MNRSWILIILFTSAYGIGSAFLHHMESINLLGYIFPASGALIGIYHLSLKSLSATLEWLRYNHRVSYLTNKIDSLFIHDHNFGR